MRSSIAVIGAGQWGRNLVRVFHQLDALTGIYDGDAATLDDQLRTYPGVRGFTSVDETITDQDVDAVVIATPAATHAQLVRAALEADKDVFVEKPLALSVGDGEELVALASERQRILMVGHLLWYHPAVVRLKELVADGALGELQYIYSNRLNLGRVRTEENILWSFAPHDVSVILGLLGEEPNTVNAVGASYLQEGIADVTVSFLSFPSGAKAHIYVSWLHPFKEQRLVLVGDRQMAVFSDTATDKLVLFPHTIEWEADQPYAQRADALFIPIPDDEPLKEECRHFLDCVASRTPPTTDGEEGVRVLRVLERCQADLDGR